MDSIDSSPCEVQDPHLSQIAAALLTECQRLEQQKGLRKGSGDEDEDDRSLSGYSCAVELLARLSYVLRGPHEYLHEFVAQNWDHGALYAALQCKIFDHIYDSPDRAVSVIELSERSSVPDDKLRRLLGLLRCKDLLAEPVEGSFRLTALSQHLMKDSRFRAWVEFQ
jgi:hypothetical protein